MTHLREALLVTLGCAALLGACATSGGAAGGGPAAGGDRKSVV